MFGAAQIMQGAITQQKIRRRPPDVLIRPKVEQFGLLDFFRAGEILRGAEESKEELKSAPLHADENIYGSLNVAPGDNDSRRINS